jgi:hypothetical protein
VTAINRRSKVSKVLKGKTMSIDKNNNENMPIHTADYHEVLASQEQEYLARASQNYANARFQPSSFHLQTTNPRTGSLDEPLHHAAEELISGDSGDPPLSDEAVVDMLRMTSNR